jgi:hypothetical protein
MKFTPDRHLAAMPGPAPDRQPAPDGWVDAYRETLEQVWAGINDHDEIDDLGPNILPASEIMALVAFAAEIRAGLAAKLILPGRVRDVPLIGQTRDEQPVMCTCVDVTHVRGALPTCPECPDCDHQAAQHGEIVGCAFTTKEHGKCPCARLRTDLMRP